jgi:hypothetical protein
MDKSIIFLDIDGVLNVYCESRDKYGCTFHQNFVDNLRYIIDSTGADIVITSTWRSDGLITMQNMWKDRNLPGKVVGVTPYIDICKRGLEIEKYISENDIKNYVIIDDDTDMLESQMNNFVRTSDNKDHPDCLDIGYGLTKECAEQAIKILKLKQKYL